MRAIWLLVGVVLTGCPTTAPITPDGMIGDGMPPQDAPIGASQLLIAWTTSPVIPGTTASNIQLEDVGFRMENLKATVDVDPNDPNTTRESVELQWDDDEGPEPIVFENAPAGRYTSVVLQLDDGDGERAVDIRGDLPNDETFRLDHSSSLSIAMNCDVRLLPGEQKTLTIAIDLESVVAAVDIPELDSGGGFDHDLDADNDPEAVQAFRAALQQAFRVIAPN